MNIPRFIYSKNIMSKLVLRVLCMLQGAELPPTCNIGKSIRFPHGLKGIVIHPNTIIGDNVTIFHQVTCGRGDLYNIDKRAEKSYFEGIILEDGAILCAGAKIICNRGKLIVGKNTIVGANAVLTKSTGENEVWGGVPAKLLKKRNFSTQ